MSLDLTNSRARIGHRRSAIGSLAALPMVDALAMMACFGLGGLINFSYEKFTEERSLILLLLIAGCLLVFHHFGHYNRRRQLWQEFGDIATVAFVALVVDLALLYLLKVSFSRMWVLTSWTLIVFTLPLARRAVKRLATRLGGWKQPTVVIGTGPNAREIASAYTRNLHLGYEVVAFLDPDASVDDNRTIAIEGRNIPVEPVDSVKNELPGWLGHPHVVVALELDAMLGREAFIESLSFYHGDIDVISPLKGLPINNTRVTHFFSRDILSLRIHNNLARPWAQLIKRGFDVAAAAGLILFVAPLMAIVALKIKLFDKGPIVFAHTRVGYGCQLFKCYKFRTMVTNSAEILAELLANDEVARAEWEKDRKLRRDPRITPIGRLLRKTSLDELPQLFNVLKGEMSLVGPRPVVPDELDLYGDAKVYYLQVRPGLTGLWQISGRNDVDYDRRVSLDTWYVRNWTLWYDILILFKTVLVVPSRSSGAY